MARGKIAGILTFLGYVLTSAACAANYSDHSQSHGIAATDSRLSEVTSVNTAVGESSMAFGSGLEMRGTGEQRPGPDVEDGAAPQGLAARARVRSSESIGNAQHSSGVPGSSKLIEDLQSDDTAVWKEAEVRLVGAGRHILVRLNTLAGATRTHKTRERIATVLAVSLGTTVRWNDLRKHDDLVDLARPYIDQAHALVKTLAEQKALDTGAPPPLPPDVEYEPSEIGTALQRLRALSGFAVPAALDLLYDQRPIARAYGALVLQNAQATNERQAISRLASDPAPITVHGGDWTTRTTVGEFARGALERKQPDTRVAFEIENIVARIALWNDTYDGYSDLTNGIRQASNALDATSWDEWWNEARPAWKQWWQMAGTGHRPPDPEEWLNYLRKQEGFILQRSPHPSGGSRLELRVPDRASYRVYFDDELRSEGTGDLSLEGAPTRGLRIVVLHENGTTWEKRLVSNAGQVFTVHVLDPKQ